jgi:hypothetical protein
MATRSYIGRLTEDKQIFFVYCHFDGYPSGVGKTLKENYGLPEDVFNLLSFGNISVLAPTIDSSFFYGRDRKEPNQEQRQTSYQDFLKDNDVSYRYLFNEYTEEWSCYNMQGDLIEIPTDDLNIIR